MLRLTWQDWMDYELMDHGSMHCEAVDSGSMHQEPMGSEAVDAETMDPEITGCRTADSHPLELPVHGLPDYGLRSALYRKTRHSFAMKSGFMACVTVTASFQRSRSRCVPGSE